MNYKLKKLSVDDGMDVYDLLQQIPQTENGFINNMYQTTFEEFKNRLLQCSLEAEQLDIVDGWKVPQTTYWLFVDKKPVGIGKIRHFLTDKLLEDGGTIAYSISPCDRNKGYGTVLLNELLKESGKINIEKVLLTVRRNNVPSINLALSCGGKIEKSNEQKHYIWLTAL